MPVGPARRRHRSRTEYSREKYPKESGAEHGGGCQPGWCVLRCDRLDNGPRSRRTAKGCRRSYPFPRRPTGRLQLQDSFSLQVLVESFGDDTFVDGADDLLFHLAVFDDEKSWNASNVE